MSLKAKLEAIIYAAEEPITLEQISVLLRDTVLADLASAKENAAIAEANSVAEALAEAEVEHAEGATEESQSEEEGAESIALPELASDSAEPCPEAGPLMPPEDAAPADNGSLSAASAEAAESEEQALEESSSTEESAVAEDGSPEPVAAEATQEASAEVAAPSQDQPSEQEPAPAVSATVAAPETTSRKRQPRKTEQEIAEDKAIRTRLREVLGQLITDYSSEDRGIEIRQVAGGFRMATKPEHHDVVRAFAKSLKPPIRLSLAALETLAVIAYKQPVTGPEITDIRGVESAGVLGTLLDRKLITTAGRKQVIGRPMQYKTSKDFLLRFGLNDVNELPSMEEFSQLASDGIEITPAEPQEAPSLFEPETHPTTAPEIGEEAPSTEAPAEAQVSANEAEQSATPEAVTTIEPEPEQVQQPQSEADSGNTPETVPLNDRQ